MGELIEISLLPNVSLIETLKIPADLSFKSIISVTMLIGANGLYYFAIKLHTQL